MTFGPSFYASSGLAHRVERIVDLPDVLRRAIFSPPPDREELLKVIAAALEGSHVGTFGYRDGVPEGQAAENVTLVARALQEEIRACMVPAAC